MTTSRTGHKVTKTETHERRKANPESKNLTNAKEVWKDGEMTPSRGKVGSQSGMLERVADAGDIGEGQPSPYSLESQVDEIGGQTTRKTSSRGKR